MTMTPWNLPHGQWSKKLTMTMTPSILPLVNGQLTNFDHLTTVILEFWPWSWSKMAIFDHLTTAILKFWPWSWSKIFDHLTMTPGRRPNGHKIVVILPPPPKNLFAERPSYRRNSVCFLIGWLYYNSRFKWC